MAVALTASADLGLSLRRSRAQSECGFGESLCPGGFGGDFCADTDSDPDNCGFCGNVCLGSDSCVSGRCDRGYGNDGFGSADEECGFGQELCPSDSLLGDDLVCVDTSRDSGNCGQCGTACPRSSTCSSGRCSCGFGQELCPSDSLLGDDLVCVDTSRDSGNCGECGVVCPSGSRCVTGTCGNAEFSPSEDTGVPFEVDTVTNSGLTEERFAELLPRQFRGHELLTGLTLEETSETLYDGVKQSRWFYYIDPRAAERFAIASANISTLPANIEVLEVLKADRRLCEDVIGCTIDDEDLSPTSSILFSLQHYPLEDVEIVEHFLVWGERKQRLVYSFFADSAPALEALASRFVENARSSRKP